jgi:hypothetical protein
VKATERGASDVKNGNSSSAFVLDRLTGDEIWVVHEPSGHLFEFILDAHGDLQGSFFVVPIRRTAIDADALTTFARDAALSYLHRTGARAA